MSAGIAPALLLDQVQNTAAWALADDGTPDTPTTRYRSILLGARAIDHTRDEPDDRRSYLRLLLAAHYTTVATFVPTDVDARIRFHAWQNVAGSGLAASVEAVDIVDAWDARRVSERVVEIGDLGPLSGHDGEWLAVRAGALGRALATRATDLADGLQARLEAELTREAAAFEAVRSARGGEVAALRVATVLAHNLGDLSRVVAEWPARSPAALEVAARYVRLGHESAARFDGLFALAGHVNKEVMAVENHRFLALREPRGLRRARELLLPIGPTFDAWGAKVGRSRTLDATARSEVLAALLEGHARDPAQQGYLRAIAGLHGAHPGGIDALAREVPARLRKLLAGGAVREALRIPEDRFEARLANRYRAALASYRPV